MIKIVKIERFAYTPHGVFGELSTDEFKCYSLENPWKNNEPNISCIPFGLYRIKRDDYKGRYPNFRIINPPTGRTNIEMHRGNTIRDTRGCILLGTLYRIDNQYNKYLIVDSKDAMDLWMNVMNGINEAILTIFNRSDLWCEH